MLAPEIYRDTWIEVDESAIRYNTGTIKSMLPEGVSLMAVVKADAYGHGDLETVRIVLEAGADQLAVAYLSEAIRLREHGITAPILILAPIQPQQVKLAVHYNLMLTVTSAHWFREMRNCKQVDPSQPVRVHIKMDTGLGRIGIREREDWDAMLPWIREKDIEIAGVYTHFATAGHAEIRFLQKQYTRFQEMLGWVRAAGLRPGIRHCAGSAAALRFPGLAMDMVRIGAALFGFYPKELVPVELKPALSLHSRLIQVKHLRKGDYIGYNNSYQAREDEWIGTIPLGYADGWSQSLRGAAVLIDGKRVPIAGKICMDQLMIRLPHGYPEGTLVTLIGGQGAEEITCSELARLMDTAPQEITTSISARVVRMFSSDSYKHELQEKEEATVNHTVDKAAAAPIKFEADLRRLTQSC